MPRDWRDNTYDEEDLLPRYNFVDRNGQTVLADAKAEIASTVVQSGDRVGAAFFNLVSELDDDGTPLLKVDGGTSASKPGTLQVTRAASGNTAPARLLYGEPYETANGTLYLGDSGGVPVRQATNAEVGVVQGNLDKHTTRTNNPHNVTRGQLGAAAETDLTGHVDASNPHSGSASAKDLKNHVEAYNNPHQVTKIQVGLGNVNNVAAYPLTGGTLNGNLTQTGPTLTITGNTGRTVKLETANTTTTLYTASGATGDGLEVKGNDTLNWAPVQASEFYQHATFRSASTAVSDIPDSVMDAFFDIKPHEYTTDEGYALGYDPEELADVSDELVFESETEEAPFIDLAALIAIQGEAIRSLEARIKELEAK